MPSLFTDVAMVYACSALALGGNDIVKNSLNLSAVTETNTTAKSREASTDENNQPEKGFRWSEKEKRLNTRAGQTLISSLTYICPK